MRGNPNKSCGTPDRVLMMHTSTISLAWKKLSVPRAPAQRLLPMRMILVFVSIALGSLNQVFAYSWSTCLGENVKWRSNTVAMQASPVSFPPGSALRGGLQNGVNGINLNRSNFRLQLTTDSGGVAIGNNRNEAWFSNDQSLLQGGSGITYSNNICYWFFGNNVYRDESDVIFDASKKWSPYNNKSSLLGYSALNRLLAERCGRARVRSRPRVKPRESGL